MAFLKLDSIKILKEEGVKKFLQLWWVIFITWFIHTFLSSANKRAWHKIKNKYKGKRVFLIGNGPSLNKTPLYLLKDEYTMCFNRFNLMVERVGWSPSFYMTVDSLVAEDMANELNEMVPKTEYAFFPDIHRGTGVFFKKFIKKHKKILWLHLNGKKNHFSQNLPSIEVGGTVAISGIQVLGYLGFKEIVLLGVDMNYQIHKTVDVLEKNSIQSNKDDDPNHFDPRYFGKGRKYHQPDEQVVANIFNSFHNVSKQVSTYGIKVINASYNSKLNCFPKESFDTVINLSKGEKTKLFSNLLSNEGITFSDFLSKDEVFEITDSEKNDDYFVTGSEFGITKIKVLIFTHKPLGPYNNKFVFVRRDRYTNKYDK